jgi:hypothetical protein
MSATEHTIRIARGHQLPRSWHPGQPLKRGRQLTVEQALRERGCPTVACGAYCCWCAKGYRWNGSRHVR